MDVERLRATADLEMEGLRNQLDDQSSTARDENATCAMSCWSCAR